MNQQLSSLFFFFFFTILFLCKIADRLTHGPTALPEDPNPNLIICI